MIVLLIMYVFKYKTLKVPQKTVRINNKLNIFPLDILYLGMNNNITIVLHEQMTAYYQNEI